MITDSEEIAGIYQEISKFPTPLKGCIGPQATLKHGGKYCNIYSEWSQRNLERAEWMKLCREYVVFYDENSIAYAGPSGRSMELRGELMNRDSPSGTRKAVLRRHTNNKGEEKQYLEIWSKTSKDRCINLTVLDKHGKVYEDDQFGCLVWSHSETHILYVAEKKRPKVQSFFKTKPELSIEEKDDSTNDAENDQKPVKQADQFLYLEDWGEGLVNQSTPVLCVLDIETGNISELQGIPEHISPGQAIWAPTDNGIIFVGWWHIPWRLGLKYCTNRKSVLYYVDLKGNECSQISSGVHTVRSPRLSLDQHYLIYLEGSDVGTHHQCHSLSLYNLDKKITSTVVKVVDYPTVDGFTGIYCSDLALNCWARDSQRVVIDTAQRSRKDLIVINIATGIVTSLTTDSEVGSWMLLDIQQDLMVVSCSSPNCPPTLKVGFLPAEGQEERITWVTLDETEPLSRIEWKILTFTPPPEQTHPNFLNYRGSSGFGQDSIRSLTGNIGIQDVEDVQYAAESLLKEGVVDSQKVLLIGGSHGGFIGCHLISQYPGFYKAFATRNPVINLASKLGTTDIPDHTMVQAGFDFAPDQLPTPSVLTALLSKSPIINASRVTTPVLILLGEKDKRVNPSQGLELYRALKVRDVPVRLLWYPDDSHSLSKVGTEVDVFMNIALWFNFALGITKAA
ncbi:acylamino-acid-releasing enzyme-like isoform X5 [Chiloscyllium plagiosum]|uniref:acylamino-acid-releasing enzyme-like isoform X5 n=1 Tax=Chiloscyllium plagiosum TaxID=36176 RepID=UPI001CB7B6E8|nr:acylamino-acid-releasing enzyme-like isoform X5 [Chiloscyllium plagiosum]